jgi:hypothetical protein
MGGFSSNCIKEIRFFILSSTDKEVLQKGYLEVSGVEQALGIVLE